MAVGRSFQSALVASVAVTVTLAATACASVPADAPEAVKKVVAEKCWGCHSSTKAMDWKASSRTAAEAMIDRMVDHGAALSPAERDTLISYFLR